MSELMVDGYEVPIREYAVFKQKNLWRILGQKRETTPGKRQLRRVFGGYATKSQALIACLDSAIRYTQRCHNSENWYIENMRADATENGAIVFLLQEVNNV